MSDRDLTTPTRKVFRDPRKGSVCRLCKRPVDDGRSKYCSDYCRSIVKGVMSFLNWSSIRRRVIERDDHTCQSCGFEFRYVRNAYQHINAIIDDRLPDGNDPPSMLEVAEMDSSELQPIIEDGSDRLELKRELRERYGNPYEESRSLEVDHITPISEGGHPFDPANLQTLCSVCHAEKTAEQLSETEEQERPDVEAVLWDYVTEPSSEEVVTGE